MSVPSGSAPESQTASRCMLLMGEAEAVPSRLVAALSRRNITIDIVRQPPGVMLELAEHAAQVAQAQETNSPAPGGLSLVIVEPQRQTHIGELRAAVASYYPEVRCWRYEAQGSSGRPRLEAFEAQPMTTTTPSPTQANARIKGANQRLRSLVVTVDDPRPQHDGPLVSEEELAMLLGPDQGEPGGDDGSKNKAMGFGPATDLENASASARRVSGGISGPIPRPAGEGG